MELCVNITFVKPGRGGDSGDGGVGGDGPKKKSAHNTQCLFV